MTTTKALVGVSSAYNKILSLFPQDFSFCFAYGSGVFRQTGSAMGQNMIDLIVAVDNPSTWHRENIYRNPKHYSGLRHLGYKVVSSVQQKWRAHVYFNTLIPVDGTLFKYGVVSTSDLVVDLLDWSDLYLAGRLHKPVEVIRPASDSELRSALQVNLQSAVHAALLVLPETFAEVDFYRTIAAFSYLGDFRMTFGEDKNKVDNIVAPQVDKFRVLYAPVLRHLTSFVDFPSTLHSIVDESTAQCSQDVSSSARLHHLNQLPKAPQKAIVKYWNHGPRSLHQDTEDVFRAVAHDPDVGNILEKNVAAIVWESSVRQSLKSILTAGFGKSIRYSGKKIIKMLQSKPRRLA